MLTLSSRKFNSGELFGYVDQYSFGADFMGLICLNKKLSYLCDKYQISVETGAETRALV